MIDAFATAVEAALTAAVNAMIATLADLLPVAVGFALSVVGTFLVWRVLRYFTEHRQHRERYFGPD